MIKVDGKSHLETFEGQQAGLLVPIPNGNGLFNPNEFFGGGLFLYTGRLKQKYEGARTAVHNGDFRRRDIDKGVIDTQARHGRQQMLHCRDPGFAQAQTGGQRRITDTLGAGGDFLHR